jgi:hypothetical protein
MVIIRTIPVDHAQVVAPQELYSPERTPGKKEPICIKGSEGNIQDIHRYL